MPCFIGLISLFTDELHHKEDRHQLRFITDNARWENQTVVGTRLGSFLNPSAGEQILRFLRGRQYRAPVLVCCCLSISLTTYILSYERSGSTTSGNICLAYISALAEEKVDDREWEVFDAM